MQHLRGTLAGGANGANVLTVATVQNDGATDTLIGGLDNDWFWAFGADTTDVAAGELIN